MLCFDPSLTYDVRRVKGEGMTGGGLFDCSFTGEGAIAVTAHGQPTVIPVTPTAPRIRRGGSGEMFQLKLQGEE